MSRTLSTAALLAALAFPVVAEGQIGFGAAAGVAQPVGDFGNVAKAGPLFSGLVNVSIPLAPVGVRFEGSYGTYDYKSTVGSTGGNVRMLSATANAIVSTPGPIGPYLIAGLGYYRSTAECTACSTESNKVGYNGGVGLKAGLFGVAAFVEARFHHIPGASDPTNGGVKTNTQFIPVSVGVTF
jgi:hypothetical protein